MHRDLDVFVNRCAYKCVFFYSKLSFVIMAASGGAAGSAEGKGYVYCMKDGDQFKIGCSKDPDDRIKKIQAMSGRKDTELLFMVKADEMREAESEAQRKAQDKLGF